MTRISLLALAMTVAFSHFAAAENGLRVPHHGTPNNGAAARDNAQPAPAPQGLRGNGNVPRPTAKNLQQFHQNLPAAGAGLNHSPRTRQGDFPRSPRVQPVATPAPVTTTAPRQWPVADNGIADDIIKGRDGRNHAGDVGDLNRPNRTGKGGQDWRSHPRDGGNDQAQNEARRRHHGNGDHHWHGDWDRNHHHRNWWRSHYTRFVLFGGGYYYWNSGFWYPAYGYDPYYSTYAYDAPIYGYDSQSPAKVMSSVQAELARLGYYNGPIDGTYGPLTRAALLGYQQSAGLEITGLLDEATLQSLNLY